MTETVFWSWQSDRPARETRNVIREALSAAVAQIAVELDPAARPEAGELSLDHDTKGLTGSPDIAAAILTKIDAARAFVADVTPIAMSDPIGGRTPKHIANPNVLIELGYAKKSLGADRVIQVWNTAFTNCNLGDLPFDMRGRRGPIAFHLPEGAPKEELKAAREYLTVELKDALRAIVTQLTPRASTRLPWKPARPGDRSVWFSLGERILINEDWQSGSMEFEEAPTRYVRMLPGGWDREQFVAAHAHLLGHAMGLSWGATKGGLLTYEGSLRATPEHRRTQATMWFMDTGEVWAFDRFIVADWQGRKSFIGDDIAKGWVSFAACQMKTLIANGAQVPLYVKLGVAGLSGTFWPVRYPMGGDPPQALDDAVEFDFVIRTTEPNEWLPGIIAAWGAVRSLYGIGPPEPQEALEALAKLPVLREGPG